MPDSELGRLQRAMEVGFAKLDGRLNVIDTKLDTMAKTTERHEEELGEARSRRWPLPVITAIGGLGGLVSVVAWAAPHR